MSENSIMSISDFKITELNDKTATALDIHNKIISAEQTAATAMLSLCESLKSMRDNNLYLSLGFETFGEYTEQACGIKSRQAYNYISTYEKLGKDVMQSNANLGITKLQLLTEICAVDRQEFIEENDLDGMSVSEVKELVAQNNNRGEQIDLLQNQLEDEKSRADEAEDEAELLRKENEELRNKPVEVAVAQPSAAEIDKAAESKILSVKKEYEKKIKALESEKSDAVKKAKEKALKEAEAEKAKAVEDAKKSEKERLTALYEKQISDTNLKMNEAMKKAKEMSARLTNSADTELVTANVYFTTAQEQLEQFKIQAKRIFESNPEKGTKLIDLVKNVLNQYISTL